MTPKELMNTSLSEVSRRFTVTFSGAEGEDLVGYYDTFQKFLSSMPDLPMEKQFIQHYFSKALADNTWKASKIEYTATDGGPFCVKRDLDAISVSMSMINLISEPCSSLVLSGGKNVTLKYVKAKAAPTPQAAPAGDPPKPAPEGSSGQTTESVALDPSVEKRLEAIFKNTKWPKKEEIAKAIKSAGLNTSDKVVQFAYNKYQEGSAAFNMNALLTLFRELES